MLPFFLRTQVARDSDALHRRGPHRDVPREGEVPGRPTQVRLRDLGGGSLPLALQLPHRDWAGPAHRDAGRCLLRARKAGGPRARGARRLPRLRRTNLSNPRQKSTNEGWREKNVRGAIT